MNADPRLQERKQPERRVFCKLDGDESCSVLNLSEDGLCFESLTPIEEKDLLHLRLSVDPSNPIEATGRLAWLDAAKHTGGLRFLELTPPAREQIRAWLSETSTASGAGNGAAAEKLAIWEGTRVQSTQLVPIQRHRAKARWHFLLGVLLGFGIGTAVMIAIFQYAGGTKPGSAARTTASANRAAQTQASATARSVPPGASLSEQTPAKPLASDSAGLQTVPSTWSPQKPSPQTTGAPSTSLITRRTSLASATSQPAKPQPAKPQPANGDQPLGAGQAAAVSAPADSKAHSSSDEVQRAKKLPPTPEQLWSSFQAGNMKAAVALADLYSRGEGVPVNCEQARILLQVASKKNYAKASEKLLELDKNGCPANSE